MSDPTMATGQYSKGELHEQRCYGSNKLSLLMAYKYNLRLPVFYD